MAFDGFFCEAVAYELNNWAGARVDKLHFGAPTSLCLSLYFHSVKTGSNRSFLIISASASSPVVAISDEEPMKPEQPTGLCMLFRKHLLNARLVSVECVKNERIIRFEFDSADEMGYIKKKYIFAEMMGKYSNILLCGEDMRILGASSVADITASARQVMVGMPYELPPKQDKNELHTVIAEKAMFLALCDANKEKRADNFLVSVFYSFSPLVAREIVFSVCQKTDAAIFELDAELLYKKLKELSELITEKRFVPVTVKNESGDGIEYSFIPINQYLSSGQSEIKDSFSKLLTEYFSKKSEKADIKQNAYDILKVVNGSISRLKKKIALQKEELSDCKKREYLKKEGDLITAYLYMLKQGDTKATLFDYEEEKDITITLDPMISPVKNAQNRYKKYTKLKHAEVVLEEQIKKAQTEITYLESVLDFIMRSSNVKELADIRKELIETGYISGSSGGKKQKSIASKPLFLRTTGGLTVRVGRNNKENDAITGSAEKWDIWFHIKGFHGSHVVLYTEGEEPSAQDYTEAAMFAAYHSEKRGSLNVGVDYTQVRYLKKPNGSPPGFITYDKYWTAFVDAVLPF